MGARRGGGWRHGRPRTGRYALLIYTTRGGCSVCLWVCKLDDNACYCTRIPDLNSIRLEQAIAKQRHQVEKAVGLVPAPTRNDLTKRSIQP